MRNLLLSFLLAFPLFGQLPPGVTRLPLPDGLWTPSLVATPDDELWVMGQFNGFFLRVSLDGRVVNLTTPGKWGPSDATVGPDGALWMRATGWVGRVDPETNAMRQWAVATQAAFILSGPDGNLWFGSAGERVAVMRPDGIVLTTIPVGGAATGAAFGSDGALYLLVGKKLVRLTVAGERTEFPAAPVEGGLFAGPNFLWNASRGSMEPGARPPATTITKLTLTGATLATYTLDMEPYAADPLGNLWLRSSDAEGNDVVGQLTPSGVLTRFGPFPATAWTQCHPRYYGGMTFLSDGRVAMADYYPDIARTTLDPCHRSPRPEAFDNTITIIDPRIAPVLSIEALNRSPRRRTARG